MATTEQELGRRRKRKLEGFENWKQWSNLTMLELMESGIWDVVSGERDPPNNARERTKLAKDTAKAALIIKSDVSDALFLRIENDNDPSTCWNTLRETSSQTGQDVVYALLSEAVQYPATKKAEGLTGKPIVNHRLAEITSIVDRLLAAVEEGQNIWDDVKLVLLLESLPPEFDQRKAYILANQNITLREAATSLASNEVQILRENATGLEIEATAMTARTKRGRPRSITASKDKSAPATAITPLEDLECWECHEKGHFRSDCPRKKRRKPNTRATTSKVTEVDDDNKPLQANIASELLDYAAPVTENTQVLKDRRWFIDSCASRHMTFEKGLFISMSQQRHEFQTATSHTMSSEGTGTIRVSLSTNQEVEISGVSYIPNCSSNLLSLSRLKETGITYHDGRDYMILKKGDQEVARAKRSRHLFILETIKGPELAMVANARGRPTYLEAATEIGQLWHRRLAHASHLRICQLSKLVDGIQLNDSPLLEDDYIFDDEYNDTSTLDLRSQHSVHRTSAPDP